MGIQSRWDKAIAQGPQTRCAVSGLYFPQTELVLNSNGQYVLPKLEHRDDKKSKYKRGPGWERGYERSTGA